MRAPLEPLLPKLLDRDAERTIRLEGEVGVHCAFSASHPCFYDLVTFHIYVDGGERTCTSRHPLRRAFLGVNRRLADHVVAVRDAEREVGEDG